MSGMLRMLLFLLITVLAAPVLEAQQPEPKKPGPTIPLPLKIEDINCITCHSDTTLKEFDPKRPGLYVTEKDMVKYIHWQKGLRCHDCHCGNPTAPPNVTAAHATGKVKFQPIKTPKDIAEFCGRCHSDINYMRRYQPSRAPTSWPSSGAAVMVKIRKSVV